MCYPNTVYNENKFKAESIAFWFYWIYSIMQNVMEFAKFWMDTSKVGQYT